MKSLSISSIFKIILLGLFFSTTHAEELTISSSPDGAKAYIISPKNGETVCGEFKVIFGLHGMGVAPAGVNKENTGHFHLLIDTDSLPAAGQPMGKDVKHFGGGQTETTLTLPKGQHTLQLILGDYLHIPHNPAVISEKITITVE